MKLLFAILFTLSLSVNAVELTECKLFQEGTYSEVTTNMKRMKHKPPLHGTHSVKKSKDGSTITLETIQKIRNADFKTSYVVQTKKNSKGKYSYKFLMMDKQAFTGEIEVLSKNKIKITIDSSGGHDTIELVKDGKTQEVHQLDYVDQSDTFQDKDVKIRTKK